MSSYNPHFTSYCVTHIKLQSLQHNYTTLLSRIPQNAQGMAIIKSDAYGHGLLQAAEALNQVGAPSFGVGTVYEGKALRDAGFTQEILILLGAQNLEEMLLCMVNKLTVLLYSERSLKLAAAVGQFPSSNTSLRAAIKCETGMSRLGFLPEEMSDVLSFLQQHPHIQVDMASTHISCADMPEEEAMVHEQAALFARMTQDLRKAYPQMRLSMCNSAASLAYAQLSEEINATVYRFGIALYGGNPFYHTAWRNKGENLQETMRVSATIIHTYTAKAGQKVGYGASFTAEQDMRIAVLGIGYADGFSRGFSVLTTSKDRVKVSIHGQPAPLCGRVCMGTMMVDISHIDHVEEGQQAWIVDADIREEFSMQALTDAWGTLPYEGFCLFGDNTRVYEKL